MGCFIVLWHKLFWKFSFNILQWLISRMIYLSSALIWILHIHGWTIFWKHFFTPRCPCSTSHNWVCCAFHTKTSCIHWIISLTTIITEDPIIYFISDVRQEVLKVEVWQLAGVLMENFLEGSAPVRLWPLAS